MNQYFTTSSIVAFWGEGIGAIAATQPLALIEKVTYRIEENIYKSYIYHKGHRIQH